MLEENGDGNRLSLFYERNHREPRVVNGNDVHISEQGNE